MKQIAVMLYFILSRLMDGRIQLTEKELTKGRAYSSRNCARTSLAKSAFLFSNFILELLELNESIFRFIFKEITSIS